MIWVSFNGGVPVILPSWGLKIFGVIGADLRNREWLSYFLDE